MPLVRLVFVAAALLTACTPAPARRGADYPLPAGVEARAIRDHGLYGRFAVSRDDRIWGLSGSLGISRLTADGQRTVLGALRGTGNDLGVEPGGLGQAFPLREPDSAAATRSGLLYFTDYGGAVFRTGEDGDVELVVRTPAGRGQSRLQLLGCDDVDRVYLGEATPDLARPTASKHRVIRLAADGTQDELAGWPAHLQPETVGGDGTVHALDLPARTWWSCPFDGSPTPTTFVVDYADLELERQAIAIGPGGRRVAGLNARRWVPPPAFAFGIGRWAGETYDARVLGLDADGTARWLLPELPATGLRDMAFRSDGHLLLFDDQARLLSFKPS